jgi:predicted secreted hydrolase
MRLLIQFALVLLLPVMTSAQRTVQYRPALPGYAYVFPKDHGAHNEFKLEWWYFTGNVRSPEGNAFGYELTFFRTGVDRSWENPSSWSIRDLYIAHFALTDVNGNEFRYFEKVNRAGPGISGAAEGTLHLWNENWSARLDGDVIRLRADSGGAAIELTLEPRKSPAIHGAEGISRKADGPGHASHYYSLTRLGTAGQLRLGSRTFNVTGESWMDHEFGTNQLAEDQIGWDWFGIQLDNGADLMIYRMRNRDGSLDPNSSGTIVSPGGQTQNLRLTDIVATPLRQWTSPDTGTSYPIEWTVRLPGQGVNLRVVPLVDAQELVTTRSTGIAYWEGAVQVSGTWQGKPVSGRGYLELTGYSEQHRPKV